MGLSLYGARGGVVVVVVMHGYRLSMGWGAAVL